MLNNICNIILDNKVILILLIIILIYFIIKIINHNKIENFYDVESIDTGLVVNIRTHGTVLKVSLHDFFNFIEYYQLKDLEPKEHAEYTCHLGSENTMLNNTVRNLLDNLEFIIKSNNKDNFYHRFLIKFASPNLAIDDLTQQYRRGNEEEMIKDKIGKQFTFLKSNELDTYYPKPSLKSRHQYPLQYSMTVHDYYNYKTTEVNLLVLKMLIEDIQGAKDTLNKIIRPTEHIAFEDELLYPLQVIMKSMLSIALTDTYKEYVYKQKFDIKYEGLVFNPHLIKI